MVSLLQLFAVLHIANTILDFTILTANILSNKAIIYWHFDWDAGMWVVSARICRRSGQNTNSSMESYHGVVLKRILNDGRATILTRSIQWFLEQLISKVLQH